MIRFRGRLRNIFPKIMECFRMSRKEIETIEVGESEETV